MNTTFSTGYRDLSPRAPDVAARADAAVADHSRSLDGQSVVVRSDANRDDADMTGHRPTELHVRDAYVHWHDPETVEVIPFADSPLGEAA
jgi:hypothetical protein